jgi:hypothetical protein
MITHKVLDHRLPHGQQWWAAMIPQWFHQLLIMGVDKYTIICLNFLWNPSHKDLWNPMISWTSTQNIFQKNKEISIIMMKKK